MNIIKNFCGSAALRETIFSIRNIALITIGFVVSAYGADRETRLIYNDAVDAYNSGDMTNAAALLLPISADREMAVAAELLGAAEFKLAQSPDLATNQAARIERLSSAAAAFQKAMENGDVDERMERNLYRAISSLPQLREEKRLREAQDKHGKKPPQALLGEMLQGEREIIEGMKVAATNENAEAKIRAMEGYAEKQRALKDLWVAIRPAYTDPNVVTNEEMRASLSQQIDLAETMMDTISSSLEDIDIESAGARLTEAEHGVMGFWTMSAEPPALIAESIYNETNVVINPLMPRSALRDDSEVSYAMTRLFEERFPAWAEQYIAQEAQRAQQEGSTNPPSFTEENVAKINEHLETLKWFQEDNLKLTNRLERVEGAEEALSLLYKIQDLLPKNNGGGGAAGQPQANPQQGEQKQDSEQEQQEGEEQNQSESGEEEQKEEQQQEAEPTEDKPPEDVEEALRKALQREREHEADKERQRRHYPMPANTRDW